MSARAGPRAAAGRHVRRARRTLPGQHGVFFHSPENFIEQNRQTEELQKNGQYTYKMISIYNNNKVEMSE